MGLARTLTLRGRYLRSGAAKVTLVRSCPTRRPACRAGFTTRARARAHSALNIGAWTTRCERPLPHIRACHDRLGIHHPVCLGEQRGGYSCGARRRPMRPSVVSTYTVKTSRDETVLRPSAECRSAPPVHPCPSADHTDRPPLYAVPSGLAQRRSRRAEEARPLEREAKAFESTRRPSGREAVEPHRGQHVRPRMLTGAPARPSPRNSEPLQ